MAEQAMDDHMQIGTVHQNTVTEVSLHQITGIEQDLFAVRTHIHGRQVHFIFQTTEGKVQKAHGKIQFVSGCTQDICTDVDESFMCLIHLFTSFFLEGFTLKHPPGK